MPRTPIFDQDPTDEPEALALGRQALRRCDWETARDVLSRESLSGLAEADRLDQLAESYWWLGQIDECIASRERAYALFAEASVQLRAGQIGIWLFEHHMFKANPAIASGWLRRARRALEPSHQTIEWGNLLLREAEMAHGAGELERAIADATCAHTLALDLNSHDLEAEALQTLGRVLIDLGQTREGMAHLDEAMLLAVEGRLGPYATGKVYCSLVGACEDVADLRRAAEWTDASRRWAAQHPFAVFPGLCRVKRADVLCWRGDWEEAEREARRACAELESFKVGSAGAAWAEIGEIRRRVGDLEGAEAAFERARELSAWPIAGMSLLRLAQNRIEEADVIVRDALRCESWNRLARARLLPAAVEIWITAGAPADAAAAADELIAIASVYGTGALEAIALVARARVQLASHALAEATLACRRAIDLWCQLEVPYETATTQLLLSEVSTAAGDHATARAANDAALSTLRRLGVSYAASPSDVRPPQVPCGLTQRELEVLHHVTRGLANKEIARQLGLSQKTVERHVSNIYVKTGVSSRAAATAFAFTHGLASGHPH
jgi:DNA-binding NarL/FixJ family response regulator